MIRLLRSDIQVNCRNDQEQVFTFKGERNTERPTLQGLPTDGVVPGAVFRLELVLGLLVGADLNHVLELHEGYVPLLAPLRGVPSVAVTAGGQTRAGALQNLLPLCGTA